LQSGAEREGEEERGRSQEKEEGGEERNREGNLSLTLRFIKKKRKEKGRKKEVLGSPSTVVSTLNERNGGRGR